MKINDPIKKMKQKMAGYRKKVVDQQKEIKCLRKQLELKTEMVRGLHLAADMLLCHIALKYGERRTSTHNEKGVVAVLELPPYDMDLMSRYHMEAKTNKTRGLHIVYVKERSSEDDPQCEKAARREQSEKTK